MTKIRSMVALAVLALTLGSAPPAAAAVSPTSARDCLDDQQVQAAIASGQIKSWPKIRKLAGISADYQEVSDVRVCMVDGVPYYTVNLVSPEGYASKTFVNAVDGSQ